MLDSSVQQRKGPYCNKCKGKQRPITRERNIPCSIFRALSIYTVETKLSTDGPVVVKLTDFVSLYKQRLEQFGIGSSDSDNHSTRLKDKFLSLKPTRVEEIFFWLSRKMLTLLCHKLLAILKPSFFGKAAKILQRHMINHEFKFDGRIHKGCVEDAIQISLLEFVCMIEHGVDIKSQLRFGASKADSAMAQLL